MLAKTKILGLMMATAALLIAPRLVWADNAVVPVASPQEGNWHQAHEEHMMVKILNLSEDQAKQLKDIKQKQRDAKKGIFEQMKANREAFEAEIVKSTADMSKINDLQAQLKAIQSQMVDNHLSFILDIKKLLTPEQFAGYMALEKAEDLMKQGHRRFGHKDGCGKEGDGHKHWGNKEHEEDEK